MHVNETLLRNAYAAFARGDLTAFEALCQPDFTLRVPGSGLLSGTHTWPGFLAKLGPAMQAVGGSLHEEVVRVAVTDRDGAVFAAQSVDRDGERLSWNVAHWWNIKDGKLAAFHEFVDDPAAFERAWRP
jgi:ketosteroid isomerase-like protein